jgi:capsular exopolysaccharide synthesis family protein
VLLVDCDLRKPALHRVFRIPREPGLTQLVLDQVSVQEVARSVDIPNLAVIPCGMIPPNPTELLGGARMRKLLDTLTGQCDMMIMDASPISVGADASILGAACDGVLMVVRAGSTNRDEARQALNQLHTVGARIVGGVLNDRDAEIRTYGKYYGYASYYGPDYAATTGTEGP